MERKTKWMYMISTALFVCAFSKNNWTFPLGYFAMLLFIPLSRNVYFGIRENAAHMAIINSIFLGAAFLFLI